jgi:hypothetical protein
MCSFTERALFGNTVEGQRSRGRPAKTWLKNVMEDIESLGLDIREAVDMTRERQVWRRRVGASSSALGDGREKEEEEGLHV